jgi:hypothetical protein
VIVRKTRSIIELFAPQDRLLSAGDPKLRSRRFRGRRDQAPMSLTAPLATGNFLRSAARPDQTFSLVRFEWHALVRAGLLCFPENMAMSADRSADFGELSRVELTAEASKAMPPKSLGHVQGTDHP